MPMMETELTIAERMRRSVSHNCVHRRRAVGSMKQSEDVVPLKFDASPDELHFFLEEAQEQLQVLDDGLLELERDGAREDLLQEIFRAAHTLKGSSATIGHTRMADLTHHLEDVFDRLRQDAIGVSRELIDTSLEALDALRVLTDEVATLEEIDLDIAPLLARLNGVTSAAPAGCLDDFIDMSASTDHFSIAITFEPNHPLAAARALQLSLELAASGRIISMTPDRAAIEREEVDGTLLIQVEWANGRDDLEALLDSVPDLAGFEVTEYAQVTWNAFEVTITLDETNQLRAARAMQILLQLQGVGRVVRSSPTMAEIEAQRVGSSMRMTVEWPGDRDDLEAFIEGLPDIAAVGIEDALHQPTTPEMVPAAMVEAHSMERSNGRPKAANTAGTIRMSVERIDRMLDYVGELVIERSRIAETARGLQQTFGNNPDIERLVEATAQVEFLISQLHEELMLGRMLPIATVLGKFPRLVRDLAQNLDKLVDFQLDTGDVELDRSVIELISDPLIHIVRNAIDHGVELPVDREAAGKPATGRVVITAQQVENRIVVTVSDDGKGINPDDLRAAAVERGMLTEDAASRLTDAEAINLIFHNGFSTAREVSGVSGRGVGMDIVRRNLEKIGASVDVSSHPGQGSVFTIRLPLTLAIIRALLVRCERWSFAIPLDSVMETVRLSDMRVHPVGRRRTMMLRDRIVPLMHLSESLTQGVRADGPEQDAGYAVVLNSGGDPVAVLVDSLVGEQEVVVKPLGAYLPQVQGITGATILGDGSFSLIVDVGRLVALEGADYGASRAA
jgi:two-component system chemotaxis sensor kinase CheA